MVQRNQELRMPMMVGNPGGAGRPGVAGGGQVLSARPMQPGGAQGGMNQGNMNNPGYMGRPMPNGAAAMGMPARGTRDVAGCGACACGGTCGGGS